jgi:hypothetical protein
MQLTAMASGQAHSFDVRQLITTVATAGATSKIDVSNIANKPFADKFN